MGIMSGRRRREQEKAKAPAPQAPKQAAPAAQEEAPKPMVKKGKHGPV